MTSVQTLNQSAEKEREKAADFHTRAQKERDRAQANFKDQDTALGAQQQAQAYEDQAQTHEDLAAKYDQEAATYSAHADKLREERTGIMEAAQQRANALESQEKALRGEIRGMF